MLPGSIRTKLRILPITIMTILSVSHSYAKENDINQASESDIEVIKVNGVPSNFGATKSNIPISETSRSVSIITTESFLERGALTLSNTINYTAGVTGNAFGPATRTDASSIRGLDAPEYQDNLQVQFDFFNNARVDVYTVEQVEVLKGPASVLYGQAAPGGIISTVSKIAGKDKLEKEFVATVGNNNRYQGSLDVGIDFSGDGKWTGRFVSIYRESDTQIDFVNDDALVLAPSISYESENTKLTALINYSERKSDTSAQFLPLTATACQSGSVTISEPNICANAPTEQVDPSTYVGDPDFNKFDSEAITVSFFASHQINDTFSFDGTVRYRDNEADYQQTWISFLGDGNPRLSSDGTAFARSFFGGPAGSDQIAFDFRLKADFDTGNAEHQFTFGLNYQDVDTFSDQAFIFVTPTTFNIFDPIYNGTDIPSDETLDAARSFTENNTKASDLYLIDHMTIGNLIIDLGVRFSSVDSEDAFSTQEDTETPISLGVLYKTKYNVNPYVSYAESFRATVGTDIITGESLKPRRGEQIEVGLKYQNPHNNNYINLSYFDLEEDNLVEFLAGGATQPGLTIESNGFEIEALWAVNDITFDLDFRYLDSNEIDENGVETIRASIPSTTASLWTTWEPTQGKAKGFKFGAGIRYSGENESHGSAFLAANSFAETPVSIVTDGFTLIDAFVAYQINANIEASINIRNLTDKEYYSTCLTRGDCFVGEERTVVGNLTYRF